ncbi:zip zinc transporter [Apiospora marii]|uniref:zip zinc transporter n=1 Tax=Apiospora marii TaxID=335849 RepID=UPI003132287E
MVSSSIIFVSLLSLGGASASHLAPHARRQQQTTTVPPTSTTASPQVTAISDCHNHGATVFCVGPDGNDVEVAPEGSTHGSSGESGVDEHHDHDHSHDQGDASSQQGGTNCHFHAGVEHCVGAGQSEGSATAAPSCGPRERDYNVPLRVGLLFVILVTSFLGAVVPILLGRILSGNGNLITVFLKQFGTGVIIATALVHLFTHASLMFGNPCLKDRITFEGTTAAIVMGGLASAFFIDYICHRLKDYCTCSKFNKESVNVWILEAGILFHSALVGLTLVVAGDSFFITLFIVILFHQLFEGIALGTRIAAIPAANQSPAQTPAQTPAQPAGPSKNEGDSPGNSASALVTPSSPNGLGLRGKLLMAAGFGITTPLGMAIGIAVLKRFNGQDPSTLIAIGFLDALSAGVLLWVGIVEMWAHDWVNGGELPDQVSRYRRNYA